jgi:alternate signal-mediated exported protein
MKKKLTLIVTCVALVAAIAVGGTLAWFTDSKDVTNTVTFGNVKIDLTEPHYAGGSSGGTVSAMPGEIIMKDPTVTNTGTNDAWIRVKIHAYLEDSSGNKTEVPFVLQNGVQNENGETRLMLDGDPGKWHDPANDQTAGYLYYVETLGSKQTASVFKNVRIPSSWDNEKLEGKTLKIDVTAEALQVSGQNRDPSQVQWPETVKPASQS